MEPMDKLVFKMRAKNAIRKRLTELVGSCKTAEVPLDEQSAEVVDFFAGEIVDALFKKNLLCVADTPCQVGDKCYPLRADGTVEGEETIAKIMLTKRRVYLYYFEGGVGKQHKRVLGVDVVLSMSEAGKTGTGTQEGKHA